MSRKEKVISKRNETLKAINFYIYRKELKISKLAKDFGMSRQEFSKILKGKAKLTHDFVLFMQDMMETEPCLYR